MDETASKRTKKIFSYEISSIYLQKYE